MTIARTWAAGNDVELTRFVRKSDQRCEWLIYLCAGIMRAFLQTLQARLFGATDNSVKHISFPSINTKGALNPRQRIKRCRRYHGEQEKEAKKSLHSIISTPTHWIWKKSRVAILRNGWQIQANKIFHLAPGGYT